MQPHGYSFSRQPPSTHLSRQGRGGGAVARGAREIYPGVAVEIPTDPFVECYVQRGLAGWLDAGEIHWSFHFSEVSYVPLSSALACEQVRQADNPTALYPQNSAPAPRGR